MTFPKSDDQFEDKVITAVEKHNGTYSVSHDGWTLWCGEDCPVEPKVGQTMRQYGHGIGSPVRGLFIDGVKVWYRTDAEEREHREIESYGADAADWLKRWDDGRSVWSVEMGGMGPGYEQCIQITAAECLRWFLENKPDASFWDDRDIWKQVRDDLEKATFKNATINALGLSGAQYGAAVSLACQLYRRGPRIALTDPAIKDRKIQVSRTFP